MSQFPIVVVKNLPYNVSTVLLYELFSNFGKIHQLRISDGSVPQGTCYVVFVSTDDAAKAARDLNGVNFKSRYLVAHMLPVSDEQLRSLGK
ncbi:hypothetical protein METBIDRAFT_35278 [Metschnikowia bicuspidata var. bicuspidata NRRL YB-4993]|uniref:RRM domain-containing protein n=1 Tax=Metschnikowia bicuspidata var. bicuspidata NRRL YB-4993 TaxID=869754 RepID=A0A1A0HHB1_9ASCO|nr:hypothetical protein METBIDRAFT_35278 [Metschnikowia bicuspidata var. bicuspidata NRRL YB-4993]OBA23569.1 hypothetical protein METBIDRAFT_35278 [Metschnikowia bicuspidata var. bicuspidata NRRL YB-4993]